MVQPVPLPAAAAQAGSCCTPQQHPPTARAETPDTAKLLQRALASSSGSALLNSFGQEPCNSQPVRSRAAGCAGLNQGGSDAIAASSVANQQFLSGSAPVLRCEQQHGGAGSAAVSSCLPSAMPDNPKSAADGTASASAASASAQLQGSQKETDVASGLLINQKALSQQQFCKPSASHQLPQASASCRQQLAGTDWQQQQQVEPSSVHTGLRFDAGKQAKHTGQLRKGLETEGQVTVGVQAAVHQQPSVGLKQAAGHHAEPLQQEGVGPTDAGLAANTADLLGHVTSQVQFLQAASVCFCNCIFNNQTLAGMSCNYKYDFALFDSPAVFDPKVHNSK